MDKPLFCVVGESGSGKSTICSILENTLTFKALVSYTTREPRYDGETGHIFISDSEFDNLQDIVAFTVFDNHRYCSTKSQLDESDLYVIDVDGVDTLLKNYISDRHIIVLYISTSIASRIDRMRARGDSETKIIDRLYNDSKEDWLKKLQTIIWTYNHDSNENVELNIINADKSIDDVIKQVMNIIKTSGDLGD